MLEHLIILMAVGPMSVAAVLCGVYWGVVLERIARTGRRLPSVAAAARRSRVGDALSVSVVVPAHNEREALPRLVRSLARQTAPRVRVVLALDRCTDGTRAAVEAQLAELRVGPVATGPTRATPPDASAPHAGAARPEPAHGGRSGPCSHSTGPRFDVVEIDHCPDGWAGKVHAIHAALRAHPDAARADLLCFTDADCVFAPTALAAAAEVMASPDRPDLLSLLSVLETRGSHEYVAQPAAVFELLRQYPLLRVNRTDERQRAFANGQFLCFRRAAYERIGGHEAVKDELLEDIALARLVKAAGLRGMTLPAGGQVRCRMYDDWAEFRRGWARIYTEAASRKASRLRANSWKLRLGGAILPLAAVLLASLCVALLPLSWGNTPTRWALLWGLAAGLVGSAIFLVGAGRFCVRSGLRLASVPLFPLGAWIVSGVLAEAARDLRAGTPTTWAGRSYHRPDRSGPSPAVASAADAEARP